jgi:cell division protease FtsH
MSTGKKVALLLTLSVSLGIAVAAGFLIDFSWSPSAQSKAAIEEKQQRKTAVHEAGHAIVALVIDPETKIEEIVVQTHLHPSGRFGHTQYDPAPRCETAQEIFNDVTDTLGGRAADAIVNGAPDNGAGSDLAHANDEFWGMCLNSGLCGTLLVQGKSDSSETKKTVEKCLNAANTRAEAIVRANESQVRGLADLIMSQPVKDRRRRISKEQLKAFIAEHPLVPEPKDAKYECP